MVLIYEALCGLFVAPICAPHLLAPAAQKLCRGIIPAALTGDTPAYDAAGPSEEGSGRATTRLSSRARLIWREASRCGQAAGGGGASLQPPQNEAMQHQGQRNREGWHHDQRIG